MYKYITILLVVGSELLNPHNVSMWTTQYVPIQQALKLWDMWWSHLALCI